MHLSASRKLQRLGALMAAALLAACSSTTPPTRPPPTRPPSTRPLSPPPILTGSECLADLKANAARFESVAMPPDGDCVVETPVRARSLAIPLATPVRMSCGLADRLTRFDREVVAPEARRLLGKEVSAIRHFGAYACRDEKSSRHQLSQHAYGKAFDFAGVTLADGSRIDVAKDWDDDDERGTYLHTLAKRACAYFSVVLTPESNDLHHDHLHLDVGPDRLCGPA